MRFAEYIGQERLLADLRGALAREQVGHAYLFLGPDGSGRRTLARLFAQALLCEAPAEQPCDACRACTLVKAGTHPDLQLVEADGASIKIEQMRAVRANVALKPLLGRRKVYLLAEMERLSEAAANSFLLTLEEPPPGVIFIGWASEGAPLLPTILSRCQVAKLQPLPVEVLANALTARGLLTGAAARAAAEEAGGLAGLCLGALAQEKPDGSRMEAFWQSLLQADLPELLQHVEGIAQDDREVVAGHLAVYEQRLHQAIVARALGSAPGEHLDRFTTAVLWRLHANLAKARDFLGVNVNLRLLLEVLALQFFMARAEAG